MTPPIMLGILASAGKGKVYYIAVGNAGGLNQNSNLGGVALDAAGNAYFSGGVRDGQPYTLSSFVAKISSSGSVVFKKDLGINGTATGYGGGQRLRLDSAGNICIVAIATPTSRNYVAKLPADGSSLLYQRAISCSSYGPFPGFAIDNSGRYLSSRWGTQYDPSIQVLDVTNNSTSARGVVGSSGDNIEPCGIVTDSSNNTYLAACMYTGNSSKAYFQIYKWNSDASSFLWSAFSRPNNTSSPYAYSGGFAIDKTNNLLYGSYQYPLSSTGGAATAVITSYNTAGTHQWTKVFGAASMMRDIAVDAAGNVYLVGTHGTTSNGYYKGLVLKLNSSGSILWQREITVVASGTARAVELEGVAVDANGSIAISGTSGSGTYDKAYTMIKLPADGSITGTHTIGSQVFTIAAGTATLTANTPSTNTPGYTLNSSAPINLAFSTTLTNSGSTVTTKTL